jgi:hypothetical protein
LGWGSGGGKRDLRAGAGMAPGCDPDSDADSSDGWVAGEPGGAGVDLAAQGAGVGPMATEGADAEAEAV